MGFGSLFRSNSDSRRRPEPRRRTHTQRPQSVAVRGGYGVDLAAAYYRAKEIYETEETEIHREELHKRNQNDKECKRQMAMINRKLRDGERKLDEFLIHKSNTNDAMYRAGRISTREYERAHRKFKQQADNEWASLSKQCEEEMAKAQRIFFSRGEEIGANAGAALRHAKAKMERAQRFRY